MNTVTAEQTMTGAAGQSAQRLRSRAEELLQPRPTVKEKLERSASKSRLGDRVSVGLNRQQAKEEPAATTAAPKEQVKQPAAETVRKVEEHPTSRALKQVLAQVAEIRGRHSIWAWHVWFSGHDWVRFALVAVVIFTLGQIFSVAATKDARAQSRIKDIVAVEGVRDNMLIGYGLVVGLDGTGDKLKNAAFTGQSLAAFLERLGVNTNDTELKTKNVAAVTVTATLPPFSRQGVRIDVNVSAMGDAQSLQGGTLLATPLYAADGQVYAVAQGAIAVGGYAAGGAASTVTKGVPTSGVISNGAIVEREVDFDLNRLQTVHLALRNPDVTTASRITASINDNIGTGVAALRDPATIRLQVPQQYRNNVAMFLAQVEQLPVETDQIARVVIDEATGTIVMGENVRIDTVAIAQGNLIVRIEETPQVVQPGAFAPEGAQTVVVPRTNVQVDEGEGNQMVVVNRGATLNELVAGLNALGVSPRDLITILQTIKAAGALQADIVTR